VALTLFIPLVIGTGGNTGAQAATTVTRALAVGEVRGTDVALVVLREMRVGLLLGAMLGALAFLPALLFVRLLSIQPERDLAVATIVSATLFVVCTLATTIGSLLPLTARRLGFDPAVMSAPFITTLVDATGLLVYFLIAGIVLGL
jgi:magnesium transporter